MSFAHTALNVMLARHLSEIMYLEKGEDIPDGFDSLKCAKDWHTALCEPCNPKVAKYAKAVTRIVGEPAMLFFAIAYKDSTTLGQADALSSMIPLPNRHSDEAARAQSWKALHAMAMISFGLVGVDPPRVPSPTEIEANIHQFRAIKRSQSNKNSSAPSAPGSMQRAFFDKLLQMADFLPKKEKKKMQDRLHAIPIAQHSELSRAWAANPFAMRGSVFGGDALTEEEWAAFTCIDGASWQKVEHGFKQLNDLTKVQQNIPAPMLSQIEAYATKLAGEITSGNADLSTLNLQAIGEDVLANCSEEDINGLASNMGSLIPALGSLQAQVNQQAGGALPDVALPTVDLAKSLLGGPGVGA